MAIVRININDKVLDKVMWLLGQFSKEDVEIIQENDVYLRNKTEVLSELEKVKENKAEYISVDELETEIQKVIAANENKNH